MKKISGTEEADRNPKSNIHPKKPIILLLPEGFVKMLSDIGLGDAAAALAEGSPEVSVRVNRHKPSAVDSAEIVPWCEDGRYLGERPVFSLDPCWHQGR